MPAGLAPRQVANQLLRCFRAEADLLRVLGGWTARVTANDERLAFARDVGLRAEHGEGILGRLHRLRTTDRMIPVPDEPWRTLVEAIDDAPGTNELVAAIYLVVGDALVDAYRGLSVACDPLADEPTLRLVDRIVPDHLDRRAWAIRFLEQATVDRAWVATVEGLLQSAGGLVVRSDDVPGDRSDARANDGTGFWPLPRPNPDRIELGAEYRIALDGEAVSACPGFSEFGPREAEILTNHHGLMPELASLALVGAMLHEVADRPWEFYRDFATQCADEVRHIGLLLRRLRELGAGEGAHPFPPWTFYDAVAFLPVAERTLVFNAIVEGNVVETLHDRARALREAGNPESAYVADWISADESLHLHNGMRWLGELGGDVDHLLDRGQALLGEVMRQKGTTEKIFDSASEALSAGDFYAPRASPVAPIVRALGGFDDDQIDRLVAAAGGRVIRT